MSDNLTYQVVVRGGEVIGTHEAYEDLYTRYDHGTVAWFDYALPIVYEEEVVTNEDIIVDGPDGPILVVRSITTTKRKTSVADPRITMSLANVKLAVISQLTRSCHHEIQATYPTQKQIDINRLATGYVSQDKTDMETFINGKYATLATKTSAVNALTTAAACIAYDVWA